MDAIQKAEVLPGLFFLHSREGVESKEKINITISASVHLSGIFSSVPSREKMEM